MPSSLVASFPFRRLVLAGVLLVAAACQTTDPVAVNSTLTPTPAFAAHSPGDVAVLPVEDGTTDGSVLRHAVFLRQEVMRQLPGRLFTPLSASTVDASLRGVTPLGPGESVLAPATLQRLSGHSAEKAVFAMRVDRWDESTLLIDRKLRFQFQAVLQSVDGATLWSGTIQGEIKAGGAGAAPRDRDAMARSCGKLAIEEMLVRLPKRPL